jgi:putative hemolysin
MAASKRKRPVIKPKRGSPPGVTNLTLELKKTAVSSLLICWTTASTSALALPNPATKYCLALGGRSEISRATDGERGWCVLPNGQRVDEWALFRAHHRRH